MKILTVILLLTSTTAFAYNKQPLVRDLGGREKIILDRGYNQPIYSDHTEKDIVNGRIEIRGSYE